MHPGQALLKNVEMVRIAHDDRAGFMGIGFINKLAG
jgi:hypothetical protein